MTETFILDFKNLVYILGTGASVIFWITREFKSRDKRILDLEHQLNDFKLETVKELATKNDLLNLKQDLIQEIRSK